MSEFHPVFNPIYVLYSQPALALLCAAGLSWLAGRVAATPLGGAASPAAWLPSACVAAVILVMLTGPEHPVRARLAGRQ